MARSLKGFRETRSGCFGGFRHFELRFANCFLKDTDNAGVGVRTVAHPGNVSLCERAYVCRLIDHDVDGQGRIFRETRDESEVRQAWNEDATGTRFRICV